MKSTESRLLVKPDLTRREYITVTPESAGWEHLSFTAVRLANGEAWQFDTGENELALTILGGTLDVEASQAVIAPRGEWVRYSTPGKGGAEYVAVCVPAFSPDIVHRDEE